MKTCLIIWLLCIVSTQNLNTYTLTIKINNIRNNKGVLQVAIFESADQFDKESPGKKVVVDKTDIKNGCTYVKIKLKPGTYGISILDDEDNSGNITYKFRLYPKEGVGFSNYILNKLRKPSFSDFSFDLTNEDKTVVVKMKYF